MKHYFVTTMNMKLYSKYGRDLLDSYIETEQGLPMIVYVEDEIKNYPPYNNVTFVNLFAHKPELKKFLDRNAQKEVPGFLKDARRFSYKVFAQCDGARFGEKMYYIDADSIFTKRIPEPWYEQCLPDDCLIAFYHREGLYTETGFIAFNTKHSLAKSFFQFYEGLYITDNIYNLENWTDCHTFDETRKKMKIQMDYHTNKLGDGGTGHIMARDTFLNPYIDHRKGKRKFQKHSPEWLRNRR